MPNHAYKLDTVFPLEKWYLPLSLVTQLSLLEISPIQMGSFVTFHFQKVSHLYYLLLVNFSELNPYQTNACVPVIQPLNTT